MVTGSQQRGFGPRGRFDLHLIPRYAVSITISISPITRHQSLGNEAVPTLEPPTHFHSPPKDPGVGVQCGVGPLTLPWMEGSKIILAPPSKVAHGCGGQSPFLPASTPWSAITINNIYSNHRTLILSLFLRCPVKLHPSTSRSVPRRRLRICLLSASSSKFLQELFRNPPPWPTCELLLRLPLLEPA